MAADQEATDDVATPPPNPFSVDDGNEDGVLLAASAANELEGNYSDDDNNNDDDAAVNDEEGHASTSTVTLVSRTNLLMQNFNEYLTDIAGEGDSGQPPEEQRSLNLNGGDANGSSNTTLPTLYRDFIDIEENNVDNPASYEDIERELQMQGRYSKRAYAQPLCHSKRVRRGIGTIIIAAIVIGVSVWFSTSKTNQRLPDWN